MISSDRQQTKAKLKISLLFWRKLSWNTAIVWCIVLVIPLKTKCVNFEYIEYLTVAPPTSVLIQLRLLDGQFTPQDVMKCYTLEFIRLCKSCVWPSTAVWQIDVRWFWLQKISCIIGSISEIDQMFRQRKCDQSERLDAAIAAGHPNVSTPVPLYISGRRFGKFGLVWCTEVVTEQAELFWWAWLMNQFNHLTFSICSADMRASAQGGKSWDLFKLIVNQLQIYFPWGKKRKSNL